MVEMEKQGKTKSVYQNITEPKTLSCGMDGIGKQGNITDPKTLSCGMAGNGKQGNITDPKTLLCAARKVEETAAMTPSEVIAYATVMGAASNACKAASLALMGSLSSNYKPVTGNDIARSAHVTAIETMIVEGYARDELDCKNFASPDHLSVAYKEAVTGNDIARRAHVTAIETMFVEGYARHSFDELDCKASPNDLSYNDDHLIGYMQKGSLENQLFKRHSTPLSWTTRLKIAIGIAQGLAFLHSARKPVIYRDFKASNILLDSDYNAKLSNFGWAKDGRRGEDTHVSTRVMGIVKLAEDLAFLHDTKEPVIYRDVKPSNILLDSNYNAKLYDFGWAKDGPEGDGTHVSTGVVGIQGYTAPEHIMTGNMFSQLDNNELHRSYGNVPRDPEFPHDYTYEHSQHIRKDIVQCLSSLVVSIVVSLGIFYNIWSSQLSIFQVQPLHKEHNYRLSIWPSLLGLFGFMVFVCAVAVMNLVGAPLTSMQKAMLIFLAILMHLQSANSIIDVFFVLVGGLFMGWHAFGKKATTK